MNTLSTGFVAGVLLLMSAKPIAAEQGDTFTHQVGEVKVDLLSEGQRNGKSDILIGATPEMLRKYVPDGTFPNAVNAFLIRTPEKTILVDTGYGRSLFDNMQSFGVKAEQIDVILITHMHGDHIGGMLRDGNVAFPDAEVYLPQPEYDYWMDEEAMNRMPENRRGGFLGARAVISAYKDKLHLFQPETLGAKPESLLPGIRGIAAYGHTPGHTMYLVESKKDQLLIWGDLMHAQAIQIPCPQVAVTYDSNPDQAIISRKEVLEYITKPGIPVAGMHLPFPGMGKVELDKKEGYVFKAFAE